VEQFLGFALPGIPYGCSYALMAVGLVLTYQATGVFNFAFGAQAYTSAYLFAWLIQNQGLPIWVAFVLAVVLFAPSGVEVTLPIALRIAERDGR
jgi:branched-subunit amino acid ABC-type transport system permease component